jgi:hypothetical protein
MRKLFRGKISKFGGNWRGRDVIGVGKGVETSKIGERLELCRDGGV